MKKVAMAGLVVSLLVSCDSGGIQAQRRPTGEEARAALVALLRRDLTAFQRPLNADDLAKEPLIDRGNGSYQCGGFSIHLPQAKYQITIYYGCIFEYEGSFVFRQGRWMASQPHWTSAAKVK